MNTSSDRDRGGVFSLDGIAAALVGGDGTVLGWSRAAAELLGHGASEVCGRPVRHLLAEEPGPDLSALQDTRQPEAAVTGRAALRHRSGRTVEVAFHAARLEGTGQLLVQAAPAERAADWERSTSFMSALFDQQGIAVGITDTELRIVRRNTTPGLFGGLSPAIGSRLDTILYPEDTTTVETPLLEVLRTGEPLIGMHRQVSSPHTPKRRWDLALSAFRLRDAKDHTLGVGTLFTDTTEQERARRDLRLRHEAAVRIGQSLDVRRSAKELADVVVPALGDLVWVALAEAVLDGNEPEAQHGGGRWHLRRVAAAATDPSIDLGPGEAAPDPELPDLPFIRRIQRGETVIFPNREAPLALLEDRPELIPLFIPEGGHSAVIAPLFARGLILGTLLLWRINRPEPFDQADADLLTEIASRGALSVDNARRYTREHRSAEALQQRLLPRATTDTPAAETSGHYRPATGRAGISGDWFDVIPLSSLRSAFVIGDVAGHGLHATATMGRVRTAVQTLADLDMEPDELLAHVDDLVQQLGREAPRPHRDVFGASILYAVYDPVARHCTLASAGHPAPIVLRPDGSRQEVKLCPGPPLGVGGMPFETSELELAPGSTLALYTDGVLKRESRDADVAIERLAERLTARCRSERTLEHIGRSLIDDALAAGGSIVDDDLALLLARTRSVPADHLASWEFPAEPAQVTRAREVVGRQLAEWDLEGISFTTELVVSELVTNAVRHATGPITLRLIRAHVLICEVSDTSNTQPRLRRAGTTDEGGRGLFLVAQLATRWGSRYRRSGKSIWAEQPLPSGDSPVAAPNAPELSPASA